MKKSLLFLVAGCICASIPGRAADEPAKPLQTPEQVKKLSPEERQARMEDLRARHLEAFEKMREELKNLSPEERQKRLREFREQHGTPVRPEIEKRREEFKNLPPEQREAKMKELRERMAERRKAMTDDERKLKRNEVKARLDNQLGTLKTKKKEGTITSQEAKRLERLQTIERRFKQAQQQPPPEFKPPQPGTR
jgi:hypothetical protein